MIEEINEEHVSSWNDMVQKSNPPVPNTPLTVYLDEHALQKRVVALKNSKIKNIVGYKFSRPQFNQENLLEVVDKWKAEGTWPVLDGQ